MIDSLLLVHPDAEMCSAFEERFGDLTNIRVFPGWFEELPPHDCFVTAGNAFGILTAGIDAAVVHYFGQGLMDEVQRHIMNDYFGEQPVGTAFIVASGNEPIPFVAHAPTMHIPGDIRGYGRGLLGHLGRSAGDRCPQRLPATIKEDQERWPCPPWAQVSAACHSMRPPGKWPLPIAISLSRPIVSTGISSQSDTTPFAMMTISRSAVSRSV